MTEQEINTMLAAGENIDAGAAIAMEEAQQLPGVLPPDPDAAAMEWLIVPEGLAWAITTAFPETAQYYTPEAKMNLARAIVPVADKYGWSGVSSPEVMLGMAAIGFAMPAVLAYKERKAMREAEANKPIGQGADGNG
ncbi:hypothetical protein ACO0LL_05685 [Undibacterium sp. TC4M20W]|uniref:hypothetical protein n=1 Tax=Undibacterium sp. TC4M20W TaxID=3413052 RepID=UPI003BF32EB7